MYQLRALGIAILLILVIGSASACDRKSKKCKTADRFCFTKQDILLNITNLGGETVSEKFPCNKKTHSINLNLTTSVPICVELLVPKDNDDCCGIRFKNVTIVGCGSLIEIEIEDNSETCILSDIVTLYLDSGVVKAEKNKAEENLLGEVLETILGPDCKARCKGKGCSQKRKTSHESVIGKLLGL